MFAFCKMNVSIIKSLKYRFGWIGGYWVGRSVSGRWVGVSLSEWSVVGWSVVSGSVVGGFNKTPKVLGW